MEKAIKKTIEGGYTFGYLREWYKPKDFSVTSDKYDRFEVTGILLDPLFWQAWTKAMGWNTGAEIRMCVGCGVALKWNEQPTMDGKHGGKKGCGSDIETYEGQWAIEWHRFIDHLISGKDAESFFSNLLNHD